MTKRKASRVLKYNICFGLVAVLAGIWYSRLKLRKVGFFICLVSFSFPFFSRVWEGRWVVGMEGGGGQVRIFDSVPGEL